jgi:hypothetical protein
MAAIAPIEDLREVQTQLERLKEKHPEAFAEFAALLRAWRKVGYKNIARLLLGEATPEQLKGGD